jgi:hypothetical protein
MYAEDRLMSWGRGLDCTVQYPDRKDTRVPKMAIKLMFWAPGVENFVDSGGDWKAFPGVQTLISTSASGFILINNVELRKDAPDGGAALFGKVYTGDIITIYEEPNNGAFLKFEIEVLFGDSARRRPETEKGFQVQKEVVYYHRMKDHASIRSTAARIGQEATR